MIEMNLLKLADALHPLAKRLHLTSSVRHRIPILHRTQAESAAPLDLQMSVEMVDAIQNAIAFLHVRPRPQGDGKAPFPVAKYGVRLMCIAPGRASVDKCFELSGNVGPIGRRDTDNHIRAVQFLHDAIHIIVHHTLGCRVATATSFAEGKRVIVDTEGRYGMLVA